MLIPGSVSQLIAEAKDGDQDALGKLHQRYWPELVGIARRKLWGAPLRDHDAEDVAQTAFISFYKTLRKTGLPNLANRHQLLALLSHIIACRAVNELKHELTQKQGAGRVQNTCPLLSLAEGQDRSPLEEAILRDCYDHFMNSLPDKLKPFAELHLAGFANGEIADRMNCTGRTVERKLVLLRARWKQLAVESFEASPEPTPIS